jgi:hypothetical protein
MDQKPEPPAHHGAKLAHFAYAVVYTSITVLFGLCAATLVGFAGIELYTGLLVMENPSPSARVGSVLEAIGLLTIAVAALELSQTVWEEEVQRQASMSAPTRVRRFISRFLVVVVVALAIEALTAAFRFAHEDPKLLPYAATVAFGAAALLIAWGVFIRLNLSAEALEPEAMARAKREDVKLDSGREK